MGTSVWYDCPACCGTIINNSCCPGLDIPTTLHLTSTLSTDATCNVSWVITWDPVNSWWRGTKIIGSCSTVFTLTCNGSSIWALDINNINGDNVYLGGVVTCNPLNVNFQDTGFPSQFAGCCTGFGPGKITLTT